MDDAVGISVGEVSGDFSLQAGGDIVAGNKTSIGQIQGVAGAGSVVIENFTIYNRTPEELDTIAADGEPLAACPYPGLDYFGPDDAARFFGRDAAIDRLTTAVSRQSFTALVGASGSGKSSVVLAGLAPRLHDLGGWRFSRFRIGNELEHNPLLAVARALAPLFMTSADGSDRLIEIKKLAARLEAGDLTLRDVFAESRGRDKGSRILLIADQFEEAFTLVEDEAVRHRFIDVLLAGFSDPAPGSSPNVSLILTMRADFYGRALLYRPLADALQGHVENLGPMSRGELRLAIETPAEIAKVSFEPGLVETLLDDVESKPGSLPLLQFALREMWGRQERRKITRKSYDAIGGVQGALARRAETIFAGMTENGANALMEAHFQRLFTQLVTPGLGQEDTRRIAKRRELGDEVWLLAQRLAGEANRLIVTSVSGPTQETAEIVHEALIRNWPTLAGWINRDREFMSWRLRQIKPNLELWLADETDDGPLLRGGMLAQARDWFARREDDLGPEERRYVEASLALRQREEAEKEAARQAEIARQRELAREQGRRAKIAVVGVVVAVVLAAFAGWKWYDADQAAKAAREDDFAVISNQLLRDGDPTRALRVAQAAYTIDPRYIQPSVKQALNNVYISTYSQHEALYDYVLRHGDAVTFASYSPDGGKILTTSLDGTAKLWDKNGSLIREMKQLDESGTPKAIVHTAFFHDGSRLITVGDGHLVKLWDGNGNFIKDLVGHTTNQYGDGKVAHVAISPDDRTIVTIGTDGLAIIWNSRGDKLKQLDEHRRLDGWVNTVNFSPDGKYFATSGGDWDHTAQLYNISGDHIASLTKDDCNEPVNHWNCGIFDVVFSPDSKSILTASADHTIRMYSIDGTYLKKLTAHTDRVNSIVTSPDGRYFLSASNDHTAVLWNSNGTVKYVFRGHTGAVTKAVFSPDGQYILTASADKTARLWDVAGNLLAIYSGHKAEIVAVQFSPDGKHVITASNDKTAIVWRVLPLQPQVLHYDGVVVGAQFLPDGKRILAAGGSADDLTVRLWDADRPAVPLKTYPAVFGPDRYNNRRIYSLDISPDGKRFITTGTDYIVRIWDVDTGKVIHWWRGDADCNNSGWCGATNARYSPDGRYIVTADFGGVIKIYDKDGTPVKTLTNDDHAEIHGIAISPDDNLIVSGANDATIKLWNFKTGRLLETFAGGHSKQVNCVNFSSTGDQIVSASDDQTVRLWDLHGKNTLVIDGHAGAVKSAQFSPNSSQIISASFDGTAKIWDLKGDLVRSLDRHPDKLEYASFSPNGKEAIIASVDGNAIVWQSPESVYRWISREEFYDLTADDWKELGIMDPPVADAPTMQSGAHATAPEPALPPAGREGATTCTGAGANCPQRTSQGNISLPVDGDAGVADAAIRRVSR